jgi:hypothetical protein
VTTPLRHAGAHRANQEAQAARTGSHLLRLAIALLAASACRSSRTDEPATWCRPCDDLAAVGSDFHISVESYAATMEGDNQDTTVTLYRAEGGRCCPTGIKRFSPGTDPFWIDPKRAVVYLRGHDNVWVTFASDGIWELSPASGEVKPVAAGLVDSMPCGERQPPRFAAISRLADPPTARNAERPYYEDGRFVLVVYDFVNGAPPIEHRLVENQTLSRYGQTMGSISEATAFRWAPDCSTFSYVLPGAASTFRLP